MDAVGASSRHTSCSSTGPCPGHGPWALEQPHPSVGSESWDSGALALAFPTALFMAYSVCYLSILPPTSYFLKEADFYSLSPHSWSNLAPEPD